MGRSVYTDGSCLGNPGAGGRAVIVWPGEHDTAVGGKSANYETLSGGASLTTNNAMELQAVREALKMLYQHETGTVFEQGNKVLSGGVGLFSSDTSAKVSATVDLRTDSNYVKLGVTEWLSTWKRRNRRHAKGGKLIANLEQWQYLDQLLCAFTDLHRHRVKGHAGNEINEWVDTLARKEALHYSSL